MSLSPPKSPPADAPSFWGVLGPLLAAVILAPALSFAITRDAVAPVATFWAILTGFFLMRFVHAPPEMRREQGSSAAVEVFSAVVCVYGFHQVEPTKSWAVVLLCTLAGGALGSLIYARLHSLGWIQTKKEGLGDKPSPSP